MSDKLETIQISFTQRNVRKTGPLSSDTFNDQNNEIAHDFAAFNDQWNDRLVPLLTTLPDGSEGNVDNAVDAWTDGLDGQTVFTKADATAATNAAYFNTTADRPYTLYEQVQDIYSTITETQETLENQIGGHLTAATEISIADSASLYDSNDVETALAEVMVKADLALESMVTTTVGTITNLEPSPHTVRHQNRLTPADILTADESAALYIRVQEASAPAGQSGLYIEVGSGQSNAENPGIKIIHQGAGDAYYSAQFNTGPGLEAAAFVNGVSNIISTCQWEGADTGARDFGNTVLFGAVRGDDGTGGAEDATNYGDFYASRSMGHSFSTQMQDPTKTGFAYGRTEFSIRTYALDRYMWQVTNIGEMTMRSRETNAGNPQFNDAYMRVSSSYWSGTANIDYAGMCYVDAAGGSAILVYKAGVLGSEAETWRCDAGGNPTFQGSTLRVITRRTITNANDPGNDGDMCFDTNYIYCCIGASTWKRAALSTWP